MGLPEGRTSAGDDAFDLLTDGDRMIELNEPRIATKNTHGTGCTLSAALAALLPQTGDVPEAARRAKAYLTEALRQCRSAFGRRRATGRSIIFTLCGAPAHDGMT